MLLSFYLNHLLATSFSRSNKLTVSDEMTTKTVNGLNAMLTRIRNELKHHDTPSSPDDKFGNIMGVSFHSTMEIHCSFLDEIYLFWGEILFLGNSSSCSPCSLFLSSFFSISKIQLIQFF